MDFKIPKRQFENHRNLASNIFNTIVVLDDFCSYHDDLEPTMNIQPIVKYLKDESDKLLYDLNNIYFEIENDD